MPTAEYMREYMRVYRKEHKEYTEKDNMRNNEKYKNDAEYRQKKIDSVLNRYYKKKQQEPEAISAI